MIDDCPLLVAANRDEHYDRPSAAPDLHGSNPTILAGKREAGAAYNVQREIKTFKLDPGLHVFGNTAEFSAQSEKLDHVYRQFSGALISLQSVPRNISHWLPLLRSVLDDHALDNKSVDPREAICVHGDISGTVSSSIIFYSASERQFQSFYSPGP